MARGPCGGGAARGEPDGAASAAAGFAVMGDVQFLPGYCVLITDTPARTGSPTCRGGGGWSSWPTWSCSGEAVQTVCTRRDPAFRRVNLEIQGNHDAFLHAHVWPRYEWEGRTTSGDRWPCTRSSGGGRRSRRPCSGHSTSACVPLSSPSSTVCQATGTGPSRGAIEHMSCR